MKKKRSTSGPFAQIFKEMINSPAFYSISNSSRVVYLLIKSQISSRSQNDVKFPYLCAQKFMNRNTFFKSIQELEQFGFIETIQHGALCHQPNIYRLIDQWRNVTEVKKRRNRIDQKQNTLVYSIRRIKSDTEKVQKIGRIGIKSDTIFETQK